MKPRTKQDSVFRTALYSANQVPYRTLHTTVTHFRTLLSDDSDAPMSEVYTAAMLVLNFKTQWWDCIQWDYANTNFHTNH